MLSHHGPVDDLLVGCAGGIVKRFHLAEYVLAIVVLHFHAVVVVSQSRLGHSNGFRREASDTIEVSLIALILQNSFLPKLNSVFLFLFSDHGFEEFELVPLLLHLGIDFNINPLLNPFLVILAASELGYDFEASEDFPPQPLIVKVVAVFFEFFDLAVVICLPLKAVQHFLLFAILRPEFNQIVNNFLFSVIFSF